MLPKIQWIMGGLFCVFILIVNPCVPLAASELSTETGFCGQDGVYEVVRVRSDDDLAVREGPGVQYKKITTLAYNASGIQITGSITTIGKSKWAPIRYNNYTGWVNYSYLACFMGGLYNVPVSSYESLNIQPFQQAFAQALSTNETWTHDVVQIAIRFLGGAFEGRTQLISQETIDLEGTERTIVTIIRDGYLDKIIRGERFRFVFDRQHAIWQLQTVERTWRCWPTHGHSEFTAIPCQ